MRRKNLSTQRSEAYKKGGVVDPLSEDVPNFLKDYCDYYKTQRGYNERSLISNNGTDLYDRFAVPEDNSSAGEFRTPLALGPAAAVMEDCSGFEMVGPLDLTT